MKDVKRDRPFGTARSRMPSRRSSTDAEATSATGKKPVAAVTPTYLRNAAMHYLSQRAASTTMLRQTLERRVKKRLSVRVIEPETRALIDTAVAGLVTLGLVDDARFAETRTTTLAGRGHSRSRIAAGLKAKGVPTDIIAQATARDIDDLAQARRTIARKRLGPFRRGALSPDTHRKDLAALGRAGFSYGVAKAALDAAHAEDAD